MFNLLNDVSEIVLLLLMVGFLLTSLGQFCFEWTLNHERIIDVQC